MNKLKNRIVSRLSASALNVILRRERSELSGESRNIMAILLNAANSIVSHFLNVITGFIPVILVQRVSYLVNKFALLFKRSMFNQDCRNKSGNDECRERWLNVFSKFLKLLKRIYHPGSSANELSLKAKDGYNSVLQGGRSMIEMLGVLAIIGVLSVDGIAGYSKAMFMWKSNVQRNMLTELISGVIRFQSYSKPTFSQGAEIDLTPVFGAMGLLPEGTVYNTWIQDKYGVKAQIGYSYYYFIRLYYVPTEGDGISAYQELCRNVVQVTKPLANIIWEIRSWKKDGTNRSYSVIYNGRNLAAETVEETNKKCKNVAFGHYMTIAFKF